MVVSGLISPPNINRIGLSSSIDPREGEKAYHPKICNEEYELN